MASNLTPARDASPWIPTTYAVTAPIVVSRSVNNCEVAGEFEGGEFDAFTLLRADGRRVCG
jgi:hypothetical protein